MNSEKRNLFKEAVEKSSLKIQEVLQDEGVPQEEIPAGRLEGVSEEYMNDAAGGFGYVDDEGNSVSGLESIPSLEELIGAKLTAGQIDKVLGTLTAQEERVVRKYYGLEFGNRGVESSADEIGKDERAVNVGYARADGTETYPEDRISPERVNQILYKAMRKLRAIHGDSPDAKKRKSLKEYDA